jgi:type IV fimbrial biogenesis protein FimT
MWLTRNVQGFTLIEFMTVIVVLAILAALAGPSFRDFTIGQRIKTTTFDLFADLTYARSEAIKTNSEVIIAKATGGWNNGWNVTWVDTGGTTRTLRSHGALDSTLTVTAFTGTPPGTPLNQLNFERNGRPLAGTAAAKFTLDNTGGKASISARCILVDPGGRPNTTTGACS